MCSKCHGDQQKGSGVFFNDFTITDKNSKMVLVLLERQENKINFFKKRIPSPVHTKADLVRSLKFGLLANQFIKKQG